MIVDVAQQRVSMHNRLLDGLPAFWPVASSWGVDGFCRVIGRHVCLYAAPCIFHPHPAGQGGLLSKLDFEGGADDAGFDDEVVPALVFVVAVDVAVAVEMEGLEGVFVELQECDCSAVAGLDVADCEFGQQR